MLTLLSFLVIRYRLRLVAMWRRLWSRNKEGEFASLTKEAISCYENAEGKDLEKALFWIKKGDAVMKRRGVAK